ncbi:MAG: DUF554 domain-containing protein [Actinomycetota bacterium]|nr:DUF554 domain-containing protein [Actinomycetota bacterium]
MTGTLINVATVLVGTAVGSTVGARLSQGIQDRVMSGLGLITLVIGVDLALSWSGPGTTSHTTLFVLGGILIGGIVGEAIDIESRLEGFGALLQRRLSPNRESRLSEGFVNASLLFCVGSMTVVGSIQDGLTGDYQVLAAKAVLDGFAAVALSAALGWGVGLSAISILLLQGTVTLGAGVFDQFLRGEALAAMTSAGGITIIGIGLKLLGVKDVRVGNYLPALIIAPALVGLAKLAGIT